MIEVVCEKPRINTKNGKKYLVLREQGGARFMRIHTGDYEADATAVFLQRLPTPRPLTHDFALAVIQRLGGKLLRGVITRKENDTFYAKVVIEHSGREVEVDARPSDVVNVALRANAPIFANEFLLVDPPEISTVH